ncbi:MAG: SCP2 sterol-binding domain-containing protein [Acidimicrobiales bacterium]|nr:SCP2 sterol-binding domain-containing protein [Acidimicrobiales bacterium]
MTHTFLTDEWIDAVLALQDEYKDRIDPPSDSIVMNQTVNDVPFGDGVLELCVDTRSGLAEVLRGHSDEADVTITTDYATAKTLFLAQDPQEIMQAFMSGRIAIQGDMAKLMIAQANAAAPDEIHLEVARRLRSLTAE